MIKDFLFQKVPTSTAFSIIILLSVLVGGFTLWQYSEMMKEETKFAAFIIQEKEEAEKEEIAGWQTYTNEEYSYEVRHLSSSCNEVVCEPRKPCEWTCGSDCMSENDLCWEKEVIFGGSVGFFAVKKGVTYKSEVSLLPKNRAAWIYFNISPSPGEFKEFEKREFENDPGNDYRTEIQTQRIIYSENKPVLVYMTYWKDDSLSSYYDNIFNQILSTFKFLD